MKRHHLLSHGGLILSLLACTGFTGTATLRAEPPVVVDLWPGEPPDEDGDIGPERIRMSPKLDRKQVEVTESTRLITDVTKPTLTILRPTRNLDTGTAMLICPGGGYWDLYWELEGEEVAAWLNSIGVTGIILKYRVPRRPDEPKGEPARRPLQDAQRAVSLVRSKAVEWGLDPHRIGMVGFSAGGHLVLATATGFEKRTYEPRDTIDRVSCRPDFVVAVYSGYLKARDKEELAELRQWLMDSDDRDFAAVVIRHGTIVLEVERGNSAKTDSRRVASVSKAVCATVLAIASEQSQLGQTPKRMTFADPAFPFIPWAYPLSDPRKARIKVKQLLNHTSGICPEATGARNDGTWALNSNPATMQTRPIAARRMRPVRPMLGAKNFTE